jgi:chemotaxis protein methyltransferase CheR
MNNVIVPGVSSAQCRPDTAPEREFGYTANDFERIRRLVYRQAGIALNDSKQNMAYNRLAPRLRALGLRNFGAYLERLERDDAAECEAFINALTTNLTAFFREAHHFPILARHLANVDARAGITLWCAAAATGEEPYTMAIIACETFRTLRPPVRIIASDVDTRVLTVAQRGVYPLDRVQHLSAARLKRFFEKGSGAHTGFARVRPELRELVSFRPINLLHPTWPVPKMLAAIFCRNIMIYFDRATQLSMLTRFAPLLQPDGLLFVGHSESLGHASHLFRLLQHTVYELAPFTAQRSGAAA